MRSLGVSYSGHGWAMCLVEGGRVAGAVNLERLSRLKYACAVAPDVVADVWERSQNDPLMQRVGFERFSSLMNKEGALRGMLQYLTGETTVEKAAIDVVVRADVFRSRVFGTGAEDEGLDSFFGKTPIVRVEHHLLHAYQAYLSSPWEESSILTADGQGEELDRLGGRAISCTLGRGSDRRVDVQAEVLSPWSIGFLYGWATWYLGFGPEQEGTTMALAALGSDRAYREVRDTVSLERDGTFRFEQSLTDANELLPLECVSRLERFCPRRLPNDPLEREHHDLAFAVQAITESVLVNAAQGLHRRTGLTRLAVAGGVALNCVANARILRETPIDEIHVVPNAGDRGLALGAALYGYHVSLNRPEREPPANDYLGKTYTDAVIVSALRAATRTTYRRVDDVADVCATLVANGHIVGWVQGGAEFGPRALGHRSIIADPRTLNSKKRLDEEIKLRLWFRPYAPSVLLEDADDYFEMFGPSPYMLQAVRARAKAKELAPAIVHVDGTVRVQTVSKAQEPRFYALIAAFKRLTGLPIVLNTSFNASGEPIVETPEDAIEAMHRMSLDAVAIGDWIAWPEQRGLDPLIR